MPQRTTPFQRLVFLVKHQLAEQGAVVTESKMLPDRHLNDTTEVDTCIETTVAGHKVIISFECRESSRPLGKGWVQQMWAKHQNLPTSVLVLVSSKGFTKSAIAQAGLYGIETVKLEGLADDEATGILARVRELIFKSATLRSKAIVLHLDATDTLPTEEVPVVLEHQLLDANGQHMGLVQYLVQYVINDKYVVQKVVIEAGEKHTFFRAKMGLADLFPPLFLKNIDTGTLRRIGTMDLIGYLTINVSQFQMSHAKLGDVQVSVRQGKVAGTDVTLVVTQDGDGKTKFSIDTVDGILTETNLQTAESLIQIPPAKTND